MLRESIETLANVGKLDSCGRVLTYPPSGSQTELYPSAAHLIGLRH